MREASENHFEAPDGAEIFYRAWLPKSFEAGQEPKRVLILFHRGHEHSGRFQELVDKVAGPDETVFAWDCRGCGLSPGPRGYARSIGQLEEDMDAFFHHLKARYGIRDENTVVVAHSVAAVVAGLWVLDYGPKLRGLVLATPALQVKLYVPFAREGLTVLNSLGLMTNVSSYVRGRALTHDKEQAKVYDQDPLIALEISTGLLLDLYRGAARLIKDADGIEIPTQVMLARADWVIQNGPIKTLFENLGCRDKELKAYKGFFHAIFHEKERHLVFQDLRSFCDRRFAAEQPSREHLVEADSKGVRAASFQLLKAGPPPVSIRNLVWKSTRLNQKLFGWVSTGIKLGMKRGFSSGETLDYVYENKPRGWTPFGKLVDKLYLQSLGWVCIRKRKQHLDALLAEAVDSCDSDEGLRVADIAGGPGRYLLDFLQSRKGSDLRVTVRDADLHGLESGRELAGEMGEERIEYRPGDAFDEESLAELETLDIAIVSGLYELYPENSNLVKSLRGLAAVVKSGGYLVYTNQPSHPQLELIAETLTHGDGSRWVMRCRSTAEMDYLVESAGFTKVRSLIDDHGLFSVSLAKRD